MSPPTPIRRFPPHALSQEDAAVLVSSCRGGTAARDRALLVILWRAGLRVSEALSLRFQDVRPHGGALVLRVETPKGFRRGALPREVALDYGAARHLRPLLSQKCAGEYLFTTRTGARVQANHVRRLCGKLAKRAGLARRVHPHAFRHTFAVEFYSETKDPYLLMLALGHTSLSTTTKYLRTIGATEVIQATAARRFSLTPTTGGVTSQEEHYCSGDTAL